MEKLGGYCYSCFASAYPQFINLVKVHLFILKSVTEREGQGEGSLASTGSFLKWLQRPGLSQAEARDQKLHLYLLPERQGSLP